QHHAGVVDRFRAADCDGVLSMWRSQTNEDGQYLSSFEREALIERHCQLFGRLVHRGEEEALRRQHSLISNWPSVASAKASDELPISDAGWSTCKKVLPATSRNPFS